MTDTLEQLLREHPSIQLEGDPSSVAMEALMERTHLHLPEALLEEADALMPRLAKLRDYQLMRLSRAMVLRLAIQEGLRVLEQKAAEAEQQQGEE